MKKKVDVEVLRKLRDVERTRERVLAFGIAEMIKGDWSMDVDLLTPWLDAWKRAAVEANKAAEAYYSAPCAQRRKRRRVSVLKPVKKKAAK